MTSFFMSKHIQTQMSLVLSLLDFGCTFEQIKRIVKCRQNSLQDLISSYFDQSKDIYLQLRKYLSDEHCLQIKLMISAEKSGHIDKFWMKLVYPSILCIFTFLSMIFFKFNLINRIRMMFETADNIVFICFDIVLYTISLVYLIFIVSLIIGRTLLTHPNTRNYFYLCLYSKFKDNIITIQNSGTFAKLFLQCTKSGISTQSSFQVLGKLSDLPFVMLLANNCSNRLSEGATFLEAISTIETDSSFKEFTHLGMYSNKVIEQLTNYCSFNNILLETRFRRIVSLYYVYVYIQFLVVSILLYQVIQVPMIAIGSQL